MNVLAKIKENNQDFEWYPTTNEIIDVLNKDIKTNNDYYSILDIGAGNGKVLMALENTSTKYAIEKSKILIENMDKSIFIVGTDFNEQTLIDKKVDVIFCNPPYSEYSEWACKIIKEANAKYIYLIIPERWEKQDSIIDAIKLREAEYKIIGKFDFKNSEDRKARANVHLLKLKLDQGNYSSLNKDPFDIWFNENFKFCADEFSRSDYEEKKEKSEEIKSLVSGKNIIIVLEELYNKELNKVIENYRAVEKLDFNILKELNVNIDGLKEGLKLKIEGLKNLYWKELFDNLNTITERLTYKSRNSLLETLINNTIVDFTAKNIYAVVIWAIKNANCYYDKQLLELYLNLSDSKNIILYKSNNRIIEDGWRYDKREMSHYSLDYRIVHHFYNALEESWRTSGIGITRDTAIFIQDIITIAKNLGFDVVDKPENFKWYAGKPNNFYLKNSKLFAEIKAFKNGNLHFKFIPAFMKKLNIESGRLNGWVKTPKQASNEFDVTESEASQMFRSNFVLLKNNLLMIEQEIKE